MSGVCQQESLPALTLSALAGELQSYSEVCEALSMVEVALGFLAMTGGEPHMQLASYLEEVLQMGDQIVPHILKVSPSHPASSWNTLCAYLISLLALSLSLGRLERSLLYSQLIYR